MSNRQRSNGILVYYVFDLLYLDGHDLRTLLLVRRKALLKRLLAAKRKSNLIYVDHIQETGRAFFELVSRQRLEGIVAKDAMSPYIVGKETWSWLKIKNRSFERKEPVEIKIRPRKR